MGENATQEHGTVPALLYDGADIDVLWDGHDNAVDWYRSLIWGRIWKGPKSDSSCPHTSILTASPIFGKLSKAHHDS